MKNVKVLAIALGLTSLVGVAQAAVDTRDASTPGPGTTYWTPSLGQELSFPYYRSATEDWGWQHGSIAAGFATATLNVSAFDVDFAGPPPPGERDEIFAKDGGVWVSLGFLSGANDAFSFTVFNLGANFFDEISGGGLEVMIDIDTGADGWLVSLGKSVLTTDGSNPGNPNPGVPDGGATLILFGAAGLMVASLRRFLA